MLGTELDELGFVYAGTKNADRGPEWIKIIDNMIYLTFRARKTGGGFIEVWFSVGSLLARYPENSLKMYFLSDIMGQQILNSGGDNGVLGFNLFFSNGSEEIIDSDINRGRKCFSIVKPVLASVNDLESCFKAKQRSGYLSTFVYARKWYGREATEEDYAEYPPDDAFFILCMLGRYDEAANYLLRYLKEFKRVYWNTTDGPQLYQKKVDTWTPYIELAEKREIGRLNAMMIKNYNANCDWVEVNKGFKIDRTKWLELLSEGSHYKLL